MSPQIANMGKDHIESLERVITDDQQGDMSLHLYRQMFTFVKKTGKGWKLQYLKFGG